MILISVKTVLLVSLSLAVSSFSNSIQAACVPPAFNKVAIEYGVPATVFYSIALAESGRSSQEFGFRVWPWALNIKGKSFYPETKGEAVQLINSQVIAGDQAFDVGVMQVSWRFHKATFRSKADYALDIASNLRAGARIFKDFMQSTDDIWEAVGFYNAGASSRPSALKAAIQYSARVKRIHTRLVAEACYESDIVAY